MSPVSMRSALADPIRRYMNGASKVAQRFSLKDERVPIIWVHLERRLRILSAICRTFVPMNIH